MEARYRADGVRLRQLLGEQTDWTIDQYATVLKRSRRFVKKGKKRFMHADPEDDGLIWGLSGARKRPLERIAMRVEERILEIRDHPPEPLRRVPGPKTILYYLQRDPFLTETLQVRIPTATRPIGNILKQNGRLVKPAHSRCQIQ